MAGLVAGRPATTQQSSPDVLAELDASITVRPSTRSVDDGDVITSAGVSAGIDAALHHVVRLAGDGRAREVRRSIEDEPAPSL